MFGKDEGTTGLDDDFAARGLDNIGAWILGRNMFGPVRGPWPDELWKGWWGENPPYHVPVFILTNHARPALEMDGGTVFHFVTDGIEAALARANEAAGGRDVRLGGGVATIRQYLNGGLIDEMHVVITPVLLGGGETLFAGIDLPALGYEVTEHVPSEKGTHVPSFPSECDPSAAARRLAQGSPSGRARATGRVLPARGVPASTCSHPIAGRH